MLDVIRYAPRRVTLPPNQPQSIRIGLQAIDALPDGEYRAHMLFRAIPKTPAADGTADTANSLRIQLIPIYGISIPVIVRKGNLQGTAALTNVRLGKDNEGPTLEFDMARQGNKSIFRRNTRHETRPVRTHFGCQGHCDISRDCQPYCLAPLHPKSRQKCRARL